MILIPYFSFRMNHQALTVGDDSLPPVHGKQQDLSAVMENLQQNVPEVRQIHHVNGSMRVVGEELRLNGNDIHSVREDHSRVTDPLNDDALAMEEDMSEIDGSQDVQAMAHQVRDLFSTVIIPKCPW